MKVLGIETSADDTGIALIEAQGSFGSDFRFSILANVVSSQKIHASYGGIFPALAKREHAKNLPKLLQQLSTSDVDATDAIAVTVGPGLEPCLWQGITFAQELSKRWGVPIVPVNHMEGHILISMIDFVNQSSVNQAYGRLVDLNFPTIALLVSGGHTELLLMRAFGKYEYIGRTRDDAAGEAFDKVARLLGLPYPGGPEISRLADCARRNALPRLMTLPRPMVTSSDYDFSFSGLKTAVERYLQSHELQSLDREKIAREFEDAVTDVLLFKTLRAVEEYGAHAVVMGGGVSANRHIRRVLGERLQEQGVRLLVCPPEYSADNALMIALAGYFHALKNPPVGGCAEPANLKANGKLKLC